MPLWFARWWLSKSTLFRSNVACILILTVILLSVLIGKPTP